MAETEPIATHTGRVPPTQGQLDSEKKSSMELADDEPKARKKRESVPVIVCRLEGGRLVPMANEKNEWLEFSSTGNADKWLRNFPKAQEGVEYLIMPVQRRFKLKFQTVKKVVVES